MKIAVFFANDKEQLGVLSFNGDQIIPISALGLDYIDMNDLIVRIGQNDLAVMAEAAQNSSSKSLPLDKVKVLAPIPHPVRDVVGMGLNYKAHAEEMAKALKEQATERNWPIFFGKAVDRARGDGEPFPSHKDFISTLDYECELAAVLGKTIRGGIRPEEVRDAIFGYTIINDITARELNRHKQNYFQKSLDGTCLMGPYLVTADEIAYPPKLRLRTWVNGELRQDGCTDQMIFDLDVIISTLAQGMTLPAGTIFATGSPTGIGFGMNPPVYLRHGDVVRCEIEGIGSLTNIVRDDVE